jgi:hypothetical protein
MPYLICPSCRLEVYSAAGYATTDRCSRCDASLTSARRTDGVVRRWNIPDLLVPASQEEVGHGAG